MENQLSNYLFFYGHTHKSGDKKCLSNWYPANFTDNHGNKFTNSEQYMMFRKAILFGDNENAQIILENSDPKFVKSMGRKVKNFNQNIWNTNAKKIVYEGCLLKFSQNEWMKNYLLSTGDKILVEASPYDKIWGIGLSIKDAKNTTEENWLGKNWLGECLMNVRDSLK